MTWRECWQASGLYWYDNGVCLALYWRWRGVTYRVRSLKRWFRDWDLRKVA